MIPKGFCSFRVPATSCLRGWSISHASFANYWTPLYPNTSAAWCEHSKSHSWTTSNMNSIVQHHCTVDGPVVVFSARLLMIVSFDWWRPYIISGGNMFSKAHMSFWIRASHPHERTHEYWMYVNKHEWTYRARAELMTWSIIFQMRSEEEEKRPATFRAWSGASPKHSARAAVKNCSTVFT